jgi:hypothetical protein
VCLTSKLRYYNFIPKCSLNTTVNTTLLILLASKTVFLNHVFQSFISGIGNWIADEVLYQVSFPRVGLKLQKTVTVQTHYMFIC